MTSSLINHPHGGSEEMIDLKHRLWALATPKAPNMCQREVLYQDDTASYEAALYNHYPLLHFGAFERKLLII